MTASRMPVLMWGTILFPISDQEVLAPMADRYSQLTASPPGKFIARQLGLPQPARLRRYEPGQDLLDGPALLGGADGGRLLSAVATVLAGADADVHRSVDQETRYAALVYDASGIAASGDLHDL